MTRSVRRSYELPPIIDELYPYIPDIHVIKIIEWYCVEMYMDEVRLRRLKKIVITRMPDKTIWSACGFVILQRDISREFITVDADTWMVRDDNTEMLWRYVTQEYGEDNIPDTYALVFNQGQPFMWRSPCQQGADAFLVLSP
jgi:hypothetical protein